MPLSLKPSEMSAGGGLWGDLDATITGVKFTTSTFGGAVPSGITVLELEVLDDSGEEHDQLMSCGKGNSPTSDGKGLEEGGKFNSGSNAGLFISSMVTAGFPENKMEDDISVMVGGKFHFERVAAPKRSGITKAPRADGKVYEETILIVTKVLQLPWDAPKVKKGAAPKAGAKAGTKKVDKDEDMDVPGAAMAGIMEVLGENPNGLTKQQLAAKLFKVVADNPSKAEIVKMCYDDEFMGSGPWSVSGKGIVSL